MCETHVVLPQDARTGRLTSQVRHLQRKLRLQQSKLKSKNEALVQRESELKDTSSRLKRVRIRANSSVPTKYVPRLGGTSKGAPCFAE